LIGSLGAGLAVLLAFLPLYALRFMGAGDVKLLACVGCVYGASTEHWSQLPVLALAVLLGGGILAVVRMLALGKSRLVIANIKMVLLSFMIGDFSRNRGLLFDPATDSADRMPYAFAIGLGSVGYAAYSSLGGRVPVSF
jgi:prepilin peptidase CpaA